jgi:hypothetical protein
MRKIPTMFERDETIKGHPVKNVLKTECQWVADGLGVATRKLDGTNVCVHGGVLMKRQKPTDGDYDEASYVECERGDPADKYLWEAFDLLAKEHRYVIDTFWPADGIYEAVGPKIQGNPEKYTEHTLVKVVPYSVGLILDGVPRNFDGLRAYLSDKDIEGIVFHGPEGKFAKIKKRDFGLKRKP